MSNTSSKTTNSGNIIGQIPAFLTQAVQILTAVAGLAGLFYALGFLFVNIRLLWLGLYETGLVEVGYLVPGLAFGVICLMVFVWTSFVFDLVERIFKTRGWLIWLFGTALVSAGTWLLAYSLWFWKSVSPPVGIWLNVLGIAMAIISRAAYEKPQVKEPEPDGMVGRIEQRARLSLQGTYAATSLFLAVIAVLTYGYFIYAEIPAVFGGGQPIVVRFFGEKVGELAELGIDLEPGETLLTRRVELISQSEDRYIILLGNRAVTFDKEFVQGLRSEPPEFFLDDEAFLLIHVARGDNFFEDKEYDSAVSEYNLALNRSNLHIPALRGRALVFMEQKNYDGALEDYQKLTEVDPTEGENFYGLASALVLGADSAGFELPEIGVVFALDNSFKQKSALVEDARADANFDSLRGAFRDDSRYFENFDSLVYGSGAGAARWYREQAKSLSTGEDPELTIQAYLNSIAYAFHYSQLDDALPEEEIADMYVALNAIYFESDPLSEQAVAALEEAVELTSRSDPKFLRLLANLHQTREETDLALIYYDQAARFATADDPDRRLTLIGQGRANLESGNYLAAIANFQNALPASISSEQDALFLYDYARALAILGSPDSAETLLEVLRRAIDLDLSLAAQADTTDWGDYFSKAGTPVENLIQGAVSFKNARELRDNGELQEAITAYQQATSRDPEVFLYWRELGDGLNQAERDSEAVAAYQAALQRSGEEGRPIVLTSLANLQLSAGDPVGAVDSLTKAINLQADTTPASTYALLARAYEEQSLFDQAAATYKQASTVDPSNPQFLYNSGTNWLLFGNTETGLGDLNGVLASGWLRVESADGTRLRLSASTSGELLTTLGIGAQLRITSNPLAAEGSVWWPVLWEGAQGWVRASDVVPSPPPDIEQAPVGE